MGLAQRDKQVPPPINDCVLEEEVRNVSSSELPVSIRRDYLGNMEGVVPPTSPHPSATVEIAPLLLGHSLRPVVIEPTTSAKTQNGGLMV